MKIGFVLDNPVRELHGHLLVADELVHAGHEVYIIPMYQQGLDIPLLDLDGVVMNYARSSNRELLASYRELGIHIFVLDTEGGVLSERGANAPDKWAQSMYQSGLMDLVDDYLFWGENVYQAFLKLNGNNAPRLHLTGNPRFDLCTKQWRTLHPYHRSNYVLINTNFSAINPLLASSEEEEKENLISTGWDRKYVGALFSEMRVIFERYINTIGWLANRNPEITFLVRPHPFERQEFYRETFKGKDNVVIETIGNVQNAIANARCVLHLNCGTAIEACLMEKLPVSMEFLNTELLLVHTPLPSRVSYPCGSKNELDALIKAPEAYIKNYKRDMIYEKYIEPWFYKGDGLAHIRVSNVIKTILKNRIASKASRRYTYSLRGGFSSPTWLQRLQAVTASLIGSFAVAKFREYMHRARATKAISADNVHIILDRISNLKGRLSNTRVVNMRNPLHKVKMSTLHIAAFEKKS